MNRHPEQPPVPGDLEPALLPVGPGGRGAPSADATCPSFEADPIAWFGWLEAAVATGHPLDEAARVATWTDGQGHAWRVVVTPDGPEVRPAFGSLFMVARDLPVVSAILVAPPLLHVELTWRTGQEVVRLGIDEASVLDLGVAMLTATELPHESIRRLNSDTWQRARDRWERLLASGDPAPVS